MLFISCTIQTPFQAGVISKADIKENLVYLSITEVTLNNNNAENKNFWEGVDSVSDDIKQQNGLIGFSMKKELFGNKAWTYSLWKDEESIEKFIYGRTHKNAMKSGRSAIKNAKFARVKLNANELPISWNRVFELLEIHGESQY